MPTDRQYATLPRPTSGIAHAYGDRVHLLSHPWAMSMLARLGHPDTTQPAVGDLVGALYDHLLGEVSSRLLTTSAAEVPTRMVTQHADAGVYRGERIDPDQQVVVVDIARAGIQPSHHLYRGLHHVLNPDGLRQDHLVASRTTNAEGAVTGVAISAAKIGGEVAGATVLIPDPMAATGSSGAAVVQRYKDLPGGPPKAIALVHLIVTPEYLRHMRSAHPEVHIFAIRLDRGLSPADVLDTMPGTRWDEERGLNDIHYIVPGAGGLGELLNNSWV